jgi:hypothetical protein
MIFPPLLDRYLTGILRLIVNAYALSIARNYTAISGLCTLYTPVILFTVLRISITLASGLHVYLGIVVIGPWLHQCKTDPGCIDVAKVSGVTHYYYESQCLACSRRGRIFMYTLEEPPQIIRINTMGDAMP